MGETTFLRFAKILELNLIPPESKNFADRKLALISMLVAIGACYLDTILTYVEFLAKYTIVDSREDLIERPT